MNKQTKLRIKAGLIAGVVYALMTAGFYFVDGQGFGLWRFVFSFLFFGTIMGLMIKFNFKNRR